MNEEESFLDEMDSEESNNSEPQEDSDEIAMREFLDELKKYRKKFKNRKKIRNQKVEKTLHSKKEEADPNQNPDKSTDNNNQVQNKLKKKRKRHKLFDPHPPPKEDPIKKPKEETTKKKLSKKECKELIQRLTKQKPGSDVKNQSQKEKTIKEKPNSKNKTQNDNKESQQEFKAFTKLFNQSIEAEKKRKELKESQTKKEEADLKIWIQPKTCRQSKLYAHNRMMQYVKDAFRVEDVCSEKVLLKILQTLGLAENNKRETNFQEATKRRQFDEEEEEEEFETKTKTNQPPSDFNQQLKNAFWEGKTCNVDNLLDILKKLDLIQEAQVVNSEKKDSINQGEKNYENNQHSNQEEEDYQNDQYAVQDVNQYEDEQEENTVFYSISNLKKFYLEVARDMISTQFHGIAKEKLLIAMANEKRKPPEIEDPNKQFTTAQTLTQDTLVRLTSPKIQKVPITFENPEDAYRPFQLSENSRKILIESKRKTENDQPLSSLTIGERERHLTKMKQEKLEQMKREFQLQLTKDRILPNPEPQYDEETRQKMEKYKEDKKNRSTEQTYRLNITKYEDYKKMEEKMKISKHFLENPNGFDDDISRHREAYKKFIHLKRLKNEGIEYVLECRKKEKEQLKETKNAELNGSLNQNKDINEPTNGSPLVGNNDDNRTEHVQFHFQDNDSDDADYED